MSRSKTKYKTCNYRKQCQNSAQSWFFLIIGIIATISVRLVNIVMEVNALLAEIFWYTGIMGFALFFYYKYRQNIIVRKSMEQLALEQKLISGEPFDENEKEFMEGFLCSLRSKKDTVNYFFIFASSLVALLIAVYQDFF